MRWHSLGWLAGGGWGAGGAADGRLPSMRGGRQQQGSKAALHARWSGVAALPDAEPAGDEEQGRGRRHAYLHTRDKSRREKTWWVGGRLMVGWVGGWVGG